MFAELRMVGVRKVPNSNQDTQSNVESYHGALKHWFALDRKGLGRHRIDWLVWQLITTIARHYMHTLEMKKKGFIKNKVMEAIITRSVEKVALFHSPMCINQPSRVMELGVYITNTFPMSFMWWNSHSSKYFVAHVNGHCEGTCVNTKLWSFSHA